jgi:GAF domain-containing protein
MLMRGHKLKSEVEGIVGYVTGSGKSRIALDTGSDKTHFKNPDLPETRSELALPLLIGKQIIGALDVQSKSPNAFSEDDTKVLETLAYQVAIAIQNANLYTVTMNELEEARSSYQKFVATSWKYFMGQSRQIGYQYSNNVIQTIVKPLDRPEINAVLDSGQAITESSTDVRLPVPTIAVPIKVRGETIGVVDIRSINPNRIWDKTDLATAQTIADRLAFALENARLVDESQKRAARERAVSEMTARIGSSVDVNSILQQTVKELGLIIGNSEVVIQLKNEDNRKLEDQ